MKTNHHTLSFAALALCLSLTSTMRADSKTGPSQPQDLHIIRLAQADNYSQRDQQRSQRDDQQNNGRYDRNSADSYSSTNAVTSQPTKFNKASELIGMEVKNEQGQNLGDIKDIVIDFDKGSVSYAVLSAGGVLGIGDKLLAVPLSAFTRSADQSHLILQADKNSIAQAQSIGKNWPQVQNPSFGAMPFWQTNGTNYNNNSSSSMGQ